MSGLRRPSRSAGAAAVALLLLVTGSAGCGASDPRPAMPIAQIARTTARPPRAPLEGATTTTGSPSTTGSSSTTGSTAGLRSPVQPGRPVPPAHPVPAAFRPAPGAPSDAEVRSELEQMAAIQRKEREQALSAAAANLAGLLPWALEPKSGIQVSVASVFTDYGLGLACGGVLGRNQLGVAHKTAPCGTLITFTYEGRSLTVPVIDRGPYIAGREWDLTGATAAALGFPGLGRIAWSVAG
jgi:rare lipoprotein A (peptidoglycan hydrolase)